MNIAKYLRTVFFRIPPVAASKVLPNPCCGNRTYTPVIKHRKVIYLSLWSAKNSVLKSHDHNFVRKVCNFCKAPFFGLTYLSISSGVFVMCHFCKVELFSNGIKWCLFCLVDLSDTAAFVFCSYVHREYSLGLSHCNYLMFCQ